MRHWGLLFAAAVAVAASPGAAAVKSTAPAGFEIETIAVVAAAPAEAYAALGRIGDWWNPAHSYSGRAANLRLDLEAGGCFCETLEGGGSIEHMRVVLVRPGLMLRLQGGLGPLQAEGVAGTLTWTLAPEGAGTRITQSYVVGGYLRTPSTTLAPLVDGVLSEQFARLAAHLSRPR